jgi:hypothetical protein
MVVGRNYEIRCKVKGKGSFKRGHEGPEEEQRYSSVLSLTSRLNKSG